jgi:hypothetical protein
MDLDKRLTALKAELKSINETIDQTIASAEKCSQEDAAESGMRVLTQPFSMHSPHQRAQLADCLLGLTGRKFCLVPQGEDTKRLAVWSGKS